MNFLIYTLNITPRFKYIFKSIFTDILNITVSFTSDKQEYLSAGIPKINYSNEYIELANDLFLYSSGLLSETDIVNQDNKTNDLLEWKGTKAFYKIDRSQPHASQSFLPFDVFAASFFLLSRYEEYLPFQADNHQRFPASESLAFKLGFLNKPIINIWANHLRDILLQHYPRLQISQNNFTYLPTIDVDNAYAYRHKGFMRTAGASVQALLRFDFNDFFLRLKTIVGIAKDPYDTFDYIKQIHRDNNHKPLFFFLLGDYAKFDKNISPKNKTFRQFIKYLSANYDIGIHPSYSSNYDKNKLKQEINTLKEIIQNPITKSRQHFLILKFPDTYLELIRHGIKEDYSMGYASVLGFRASICTPFKFYDLRNEAETELKIFPFSVMDVTLRDYMKLTTDEADIQINNIINEIKAVNGMFISLWHNESLRNSGKWRKWLTVYEKMTNILDLPTF